MDVGKKRDIFCAFIFSKDSVEEGEGGMIWENGMETCIISYKKRIASPGLMQDAWAWCTGMTQRDGTGERWEGDSGWGAHVHPRRIHVDVWQNQKHKAETLLCQQRFV